MQPRSFGFLYVLLLALPGLLAMPVHAEIYKWTDKNGGVHYTESPPPTGDYKTVKPKSAPGDANAPQELQQQIQTQEAKDDVKRAEDKEAEQKMAQKEAKRLNCQRANDALANLKNGRGAYHTAVPDGNGGYQRLTQEDYDARVAKLQGQAADFCKEY